MEPFRGFHLIYINMKTPYGELNVGDVYAAADGSNHRCQVTDVATYADVEDAMVKDLRTGERRRIDWFKLMMVRYTKE